MPREYSQFLETRYDAVTGWKNPPATTFYRSSKCHSASYSYDSLGARTKEGREPDPSLVRVITVGDSYTNGNEADFADSYPAQLEQMAGVGVANWGVSGFGPLQATLTYEQVAPYYPNADIVILGIMHENIRRLVNSFRPALLRSSGVTFGFKPYVEVGADGPRFRENQNAPPSQQLDELVARARTALRNDYWAKGESRFPYSVAFVRGLSRNNFRKWNLGALLKRAGGMEFSIEYGDDALTEAMTFTIQHFASMAQSNGMKPVVLFIPQGASDSSAPDFYMERLRKHVGDSVLVVGVGQSVTDWPQYATRGCHPTPYGYGKIAETVLMALQDKGWLQSPAGIEP